MPFAKRGPMQLRRTLLALSIATTGLLPVNAFAQTRSGISVRGTMVADSRWNDGPYTQVEAAGANTIALRTDGTIVVWGMNVSSECVLPPPPNYGVTYVEVATAGWGRFLARRSDGRIDAWSFYTVGLPPPLPLGSSYEHMAIGPSHALAVRSGGVVVAWGSNLQGQCSVPTPPAGTWYVDVAAGSQHSLALRADGTVVAWGSNALRQCDVPPLPSGLTYVAIWANGQYSVARRSDASLIAWGSNRCGQCNIPPLPAGTSYVDFSAGEDFAVACRSDGVLVAWGRNDVDQCKVPPPHAGSNYVRVSAGAWHACAVRSDGSVACWGANDRGQCNIPDPPPGTTYLDAAAGNSHFLVLRSDGNIIGWGPAYNGEITAPPLPAGVRYVEIAAGNQFSLARRNDGQVAVWGSGYANALKAPALPPGTVYEELDPSGYLRRSDGQLVNLWPNSTAAPSLPAGTRYLEVASGGHYLARRSDGIVRGWSSSGSPWTAPAPPSGTNFVGIASRGSLGLGLTNAGTILAWMNGVAQPSPLAGNGYVKLVAGGSGIFALRNDGQISMASAPFTPAMLQPPAGWNCVAISAGSGLAVAVYSELASPTTYCTAKLNSLGCTPSLSYEGLASASSGFGFEVVGSQIRNQTPGVLLHSLSGRQALPFQGGTLCIRFPIAITTSVFSLGAPRPVNDCSGMYRIDMNAFASGSLGGAPAPALRIPGGLVDCQYWGRDPGFAAPNNSTLTNALEYVIGV